MTSSKVQASYELQSETMESAGISGDRSSTMFNPQVPLTHRFLKLISCKSIFILRPFFPVLYPPLSNYLFVWYREVILHSWGPV